jgi:hypothetical protein
MRCWVARLAEATPAGPAATKTDTEGAEQKAEAAEPSPQGAEQILEGVGSPGGEGRNLLSGRPSRGGSRQQPVRGLAPAAWRQVYKALGNTFASPGMWRKSSVNSATNASCRCWRADQRGESWLTADTKDLLSVGIDSKMSALQQEADEADG